MIQFWLRIEIIYDIIHFVLLWEALNYDVPL